MEQGKSVADSWKAVFVESSAKENKVDSLSGKVYSLQTFLFFLLTSLPLLLSAIKYGKMQLQFITLFTLWKMWPGGILEPCSCNECR